MRGVNTCQKSPFRFVNCSPTFRGPRCLPSTKTTLHSRSSSVMPFTSSTVCPRFAFGSKREQTSVGADCFRRGDVAERAVIGCQTIDAHRNAKGQALAAAAFFLDFSRGS